MKIKKAFTLVELLVVIGIIGILTATVVVGMSSARKKSRDAKRISDVNMVSAALQLYYADNHTYPTAAAAPVSFDTLVTSLVAGKYMDAAIAANPYPSSSYGCNKYFYTYDSSTVTYKLYFAPENRTANANCSGCAVPSPAPSCSATGLYLLKNGQASSTW